MVAGLISAIPLEDNPLGDRGFSVINAIGDSVYIYSVREPSEEHKQYYIDQSDKDRSSTILQLYR